MEVFDGQNRLLAAKKLGVPIYYEIFSELECYDIIRLNNSKKWTLKDYLNFYCAHDYPEYIKLRDLESRIGVNIITLAGIARINETSVKFKEGWYKFPKILENFNFHIIIHSIKILKTIKFDLLPGIFNSPRLWDALFKLSFLENFNENKWFHALNQRGYKFFSRSRVHEYMELFVDIYNKCTKKAFQINYSKSLPLEE